MPATMSVGVPIIALLVLTALALIARHRAYRMTSTSLLFMSAALAAGLLVSYSILG
jgi:hypothetical protein